jgi:hypothetical protein
VSSTSGNKIQTSIRRSTVNRFFQIETNSSKKLKIIFRDGFFIRKQLGDFASHGKNRYKKSNTVRPLKVFLGIFPFLLTPQVARQAIAQQEHAHLRKPLQESAVNQIQKVCSWYQTREIYFTKKAKKRSFRIDDILSEDQNETPLNALLELTHSNSFGSSSNEFSVILGKNHRSKKRRKSRTAFSNYQLQ